MKELELYESGGELQPYSPSQPLAPRGEVPADYLGDNTPSIQPGAMPPEVERNFGQIAGLFQSDFAQLGMPQYQIEKTIAWFKQALANPPQGRQPRNHGYELHEHRADEMFNAFAVQARDWGISQQQMSNICWWVSEFQRRIDDQQQQQVAPELVKPVSGDPTDELSEADYEKVQRINDRARAETLGYLKTIWHDSFDANLRMVNAHYMSLPKHEQEHLAQYTRGWVRGTNTSDIILGLYNQAIGTLPQSGAGIAQEIEALEKIIRYERKRWLSDEKMQARYRRLITLREGR